MKKTLLSILTITCSILSINAQVVVYVNQNATGLNNGTSWTDAYTSLETALSSNTVAQAQIWITSGTYIPSSVTTSFYIDHAESLYGGFNGTETSLEERSIDNDPTIFSGDILGNDNGYNNAYAGGGTYSDNVHRLVEINPYDLTIANLSMTFDGITFTGARNEDNGGGAIANGSYQTQSELRLNNCIFENNYASSYSVLMYYTHNGNAQLHMYNSIIRNNFTQNGYTIEYRLTDKFPSNLTTEVHIVNCLFQNNAHSSESAGGGCGRFTNLKQAYINVYLVNNTFIDNYQGVNTTKKSLFCIERGNYSAADITVYPSNNIIYDNENVEHVVSITNGKALTGWSSSATNGNVMDFEDSDAPAGNHLITSSPFMGYENGNFQPAWSYATQANLNAYSSSYPTTDITGSSRFTENGALAYGAYQNTGACVENETVDMTACYSVKSPSGKYLWEIGGTYVDTVSTACGIKIFTINLTMLDLDATITTNADTTELSAPEVEGMVYEWYSCEGDNTVLGNDVTFVPTEPGTYFYYGYIEGSECEIESECVEVSHTGSSTKLTRNSAPVFELYPNPSKGVISIEQSEVANAQLYIYTLSGIEVMQRNIQTGKTTVDLSHLPKGYYLVKTSGGETNQAQKLLIQ